MKHEQYLEWISAALDGELTPEERASLDTHLAVCPQCARLYQRLSSQSAALRELDCDLPDGLDKRILEHLPPQEVRPPKGRVIHWRRWASLAACLAVVVTSAFALTRRQPPQPVPFAAYSDTETAPPEASDNGETQPRFINPAAGTDDPAAGTALPDDGLSPITGGLPEALSEPEHYAFSNEQRIRVSWGHTPPPSARILSSSDQLADFLAQFPENDLSNVSGTYDDAYFQTNRLLAVVVEANSGSVQYTLDPQGLTREQVTVLCQRPEIGTCDMAAWLILAEVDTLFDGGETLTLLIR